MNADQKSKTATPWGPVGYFTYKRTYARKLNPDDSMSETEEFADTIKRVLDACDTQLKVGFTPEERTEAEGYLLGLKGSVAGRFLWQLGTTTVDRLGLFSLQNCSVTLVNEPIAPFTWAFDALMLGSGVGYNIQKKYVYELPKPKAVKITRKDTNDADFIVPDSREGWIKLLHNVLHAHFIDGKSFSYSTVLIRGRGALIKGFGGTASGPEELCWGMDQISQILNARAGKKVRPIDALDIMNIIGYIVVAGNVRRSAQIALGDADDPLFMNAKRWDLGSIPNWRAMSNNSAICSDTKHLPDSFWEGYKGNGEPYGLINIKLAQKMGRTGEFQYPDNSAVAVNPCVSGDTTILTPEGYKRIDSLVDQAVSIWNGFEWSTVTPRVTGANQPTVKIKFSDGRELQCTPYHKFHISTSYRGASKVVEAKDLTPGNKLIKSQFPVLEGTGELKHAYTQGFVSAEGMEENRSLYVYAPKDMCMERLQGIRSVSQENGRKRITLEEKPVSKDFVPINYSVKTRLEWLAGLFDGDGTELKEGGLQLASVNRAFMADLQILLSTLGVQTKILHANDAGMRSMPDGRGGVKDYFCQETTRICIGAKQMQDLKALGLKCERMAFNKAPQRDASQFVQVVSVEPAETLEKVYCFNEPKRHLGVFNGVVTGQCGEMTLSDKETCCLAEVFLPNIVSIEELKKVATYLYRINKHSLALPCHQEATEEIVHKNMRMGIGVTGYLQATEEQKSWLPEVYTYLRAFDVEYSRAHGWPASVKLTTVKPSGSLSLLAGVTPGVHPGYSQYFIRRIRVASNSPLVSACRDNGYPVEYQKNFDGTEDKNTVVVSFPCSYPDGTVVAKDLSAVQQLEYVKRLQAEWSDNAVSCTVYYKKEELADIRAWLEKNYKSTLKSVSFLLHSEHGFVQAPYEEIDLDAYLKLSAKVKPFVGMSGSFDDVLDSLECASGSCPVR